MAMEGDLDPPFSSFNQAGGRLLSSREPLQLISASDLPDWIRQIADADAVKAQEEALKAAEEPEAQSDFQRSLQTDANASGPSTSWLTKSTGPLQSSDPWDSPDATKSSMNAEPASQVPAAPAYPTIMPTPTYMPETSAAQSSGKRLSFGLSGQGSGERRPIYTSKPFMIAAIVVLILLLVVLM